MENVGDKPPLPRTTVQLDAESVRDVWKRLNGLRQMTDALRDDAHLAAEFAPFKDELDRTIAKIEKLTKQDKGPWFVVDPARMEDARDGFRPAMVVILQLAIKHRMHRRLGPLTGTIERAFRTAYDAMDNASEAALRYL
ncbi:MAG: hypothetical protein ACR2JY_04345 [Chloroflexota bacterium]